MLFQKRAIQGDTNTEYLVTGISDLIHRQNQHAQLENGSYVISMWRVWSWDETKKKHQ